MTGGRQERHNPMQKEKEITKQSFVICPLCHHACKLGEGQSGFCGARRNTGGKAAAAAYAAVSALALDPIKKMQALSSWLASVHADIPLHISRFFPHYRMLDKPPTPPETIRRLAGIARERLTYVYMGNL